jgi:tRNA (guanine-N7-)-methyltransferase
VPNLSLIFDDYTERFYERQLSRLRELARNLSLPDEIHLEIGANRGRFLDSMAANHADDFFIGIELRSKFARLGRSRLSRNERNNALMVCGDARLAVPILLNDAQVCDTFVLFPDPWWKQRHRKRRIIETDFLDLLAQKTKPGGGLWIRTDVGPLADDMRETLDRHPHFEPVCPSEYPERFEQTTRETHILEAGLPIYPVYYRRVLHAV